MIPTLQRIIGIDPDLGKMGYRRPRTSIDDIRALIISPTRELAEQISVEAKRLTKNTSVIVQTAVGGTQKRMHLQQMKREGCHILVGTPGRLFDLFSDPYSGVKAPRLQSLVYDEADRLLDSGFQEEIGKILKELPTRAEQDRQTLLFSATVPDEVKHLVRSTLKPDFQFVQTIKEDEAPTHERVPQRAVIVRSFENCLPALVELCLKALEDATKEGGRPFKAIVYFPNTADVILANYIFRGLKDPDSSQRDSFGSFSGRHPLAPARLYEIHAKLSQSSRTRAAENFKTCKSGILFSSDVTARGMDFPEVTHVINMHLPPTREQYIHRIGRTGRAGKEGESWIIASEIERNEMRQRLRGFPLLNATDTISTATVDMTRESEMAAPTAKILRMASEAAKAAPVDLKVTAFSSRIGVFQYIHPKSAFIENLNNQARFGWGLDPPPRIAPGLAAKMGLSRVPGVNTGSDPYGSSEDRGDRRGGGGGYGDRGDRRGGGGGFGSTRSFGDRFEDRGGRGGDRGGRSGDRDAFSSDRGGSGGFGGYGRDRGGDRQGFRPRSGGRY